MARNDGRYQKNSGSHLVREALYVVEGESKMTDQKKAAGVFAPPTTATQEQSAANVPPAEKFRKLRAEFRGDCRVPLGYTLFPAEFLSKRGTARWIDLIRKATRAGVQIDLVYGEFRHRPRYLIQRNREVLACLADADAADRYLAELGGRHGV